MVKQTITFSDGSETVINYRGVIVDGVLQSEPITNNKSTMDDETEVETPQETPVEETVETPEEETKQEVDAD